METRYEAITGEGSVEADLVQGFVNQFGSYNAETQAYEIDSLHTSLLSSLPFIGKFIGCFVAGPMIEKYGHRVVFYALSVISIIGVISELNIPKTSCHAYMS